jgi:hypothetical protein
LKLLCLILNRFSYISSLRFSFILLFSQISASIVFNFLWVDGYRLEIWNASFSLLSQNRVIIESIDIIGDMKCPK